MTPPPRMPSDPPRKSTSWLALGCGAAASAVVIAVIVVLAIIAWVFYRASQG